MMPTAFPSARTPAANEAACRSTASDPGWTGKTGAANLVLSNAVHDRTAARDDQAGLGNFSETLVSALAFVAAFSRDAADITPAEVFPVGVLPEDAAPVPATFPLWLAAVGTLIWVGIGVTGNATVAVAGPISRAADISAAMRIRCAAFVFATMLALKAALGNLAVLAGVVSNAEVARIVSIALVANELAILFFAGVVWIVSVAGAAAAVRILDPQILEAILAAPQVVFLLVLLALVIPLSLALFLVLLCLLFLLGVANLAGGAECETRHERTGRAEKSATWGFFGQGAMQVVKPVFGCHTYSFRSVARARSHEQGSAWRR
jgi:hypothetical protein